MKGNSIFSGDLSLNMNNATLNVKIENYIVTIRDLEQEIQKVVEREQYYQQLSKDALVPGRADMYLLKHAQTRLNELHNHEIELAAMLDMFRTDGAKYNDEYIITIVVSRASAKVLHAQISKYRDLPSYGPTVSQLVDL